MFEIVHEGRQLGEVLSLREGLGEDNGDELWVFVNMRNKFIRFPSSDLYLM